MPHQKVMNKRKKWFGYFGWKEFQSNRKELLAEFDRSKLKNQSRPVKTEHGIAGEAAIREWLSNFLPTKYGVTSGYIIPDIITTEYKLFHYDIILYDKLNSPILWIDGDYDTSEQGKKRAIPAKYILAVFEVKSTFDNKSVSDSLDKLSEIAPIEKYFHKNFFTSTIFFDLPAKSLHQPNILANFLNKQPISFHGGIILRSDINPDMIGKIELVNEKDSEGITEKLDAPLAKDLEELEINMTEKGAVTIGPGASATFTAGNNKTWYVNKTYYGPMLLKDDTAVTIGWSYNNFSRYIIEILALLDGIGIRENLETVYGQVFDILDLKKDDKP